MATRGGQDVKTELWQASRFDALLQTETYIVVSTGTSVVTIPTDFDHENTLTIYYGSARGRLQAAQTNAVTIDSNDGAGDQGYNGYYFFTLTNVGSGQYCQINQYTGTTKVASLTQSFGGTTPNSTTDYLIGLYSQHMVRTNDHFQPHQAWLPRLYSIVGYTLRIWPPPDIMYAILMDYSPNVTRIDEQSDVFVKWLRERSTLVKQGIKVKTMQLFDDDRYPAELQRWEQMKQAYGAQNPTYRRTEFWGSR